MLVRLLASAVVAALLLVGVGPSASQPPAKFSAAPLAVAQAPATPVEPITADEAQKIALEQAGLTADQVTEQRIHLDIDEEVPHYDVEFRQGDWEYDYEISETGQVLDADKEFDPVDPTLPVPTEPAPVQPETLTAEQAKAIALTHAGLTADQVTALLAEFDVDDRIPEWDVDFRQGDWEYDYTIHAETGAILEWDREFDPADPVPTEPAPVQPETLTAEQAKAIALTHAGLTADQVRHLKVEFDREDGIPVFEVDFDQKGWEYEYTIHAETGAILEWDKEFDD